MKVWCQECWSPVDVSLVHIVWALGLSLTVNAILLLTCYSNAGVYHAAAAREAEREAAQAVLVKHYRRELGERDFALGWLRNSALLAKRRDAWFVSVIQQLLKLEWETAVTGNSRLAWDHNLRWCRALGVLEPGTLEWTDTAVYIVPMPPAE